MKKIIYFLIITLSLNSCNSQVKEIYYEVLKIENITESKGYLRGIYELSLIIVKNNTNFDSYEFLINCDESKSFSENGSEFLLGNEKIFKNKDFKKFSSCDLHEFLSGKIFNVIYKDNQTKKYKKWAFMYRGTAKNTIKTDVNNKI
jgi:hypothetical protein